MQRKTFKVYIAPIDVLLARKSKEDKGITFVLQLDVSVICALSKLINKKVCLGERDIVVEVLSPCNSAIEIKYKLYVNKEAVVKDY